jgi:hypothetical protein
MNPVSWPRLFFPSCLNTTTLSPHPHDCVVLSRQGCDTLITMLRLQQPDQRFQQLQRVCVSNWRSQRAMRWSVCLRISPAIQRVYNHPSPTSKFLSHNNPFTLSKAEPRVRVRFSKSSPSLPSWSCPSFSPLTLNINLKFPRPRKHDCAALSNQENGHVSVHDSSAGLRSNHPKTGFAHVI